jgi:hypothetical protein
MWLNKWENKTEIQSFLAISIVIEGRNGIIQFFILFLLKHGMHNLFYITDSLKFLNVIVILLHMYEVSGLNSED